MSEETEPRNPRTAPSGGAEFRTAMVSYLDARREEVRDAVSPRFFEVFLPAVTRSREIPAVDAIPLLSPDERGMLGAFGRIAYGLGDGDGSVGTLSGLLLLARIFERVRALCRIRTLGHGER